MKTTSLELPSPISSKLLQMIRSIDIIYWKAISSSIYTIISCIKLRVETCNQALITNPSFTITCKNMLLVFISKKQVQVPPRVERCQAKPKQKLTLPVPAYSLLLKLHTYFIIFGCLKILYPIPSLDLDISTIIHITHYIPSHYFFPLFSYPLSSNRTNVSLSSI